MKACTKCGKEKELEEFGDRKDTKDGKRSQCKVCRAAKNKKWRDSNKEKTAMWQKNHREKNKEEIYAKQKEYRDNNAKKEAARHVKYRDNNRDKCYVVAAKYRAAKLRAIPCWYESEIVFILFLYAEAIRRKLTIDHDIPLQHELVCGLHTIANLQLMLGSENFAKCNKFEII